MDQPARRVAYGSLNSECRCLKLVDTFRPPERMETKANLTKLEPGAVVALNFRVPAEFKRDFKIASATIGITQSELLQRAFRFWEGSRS